MTEAHSAAGSMAGYLWQIRRALLALFDLDVDEYIELETVDDVVIRAADEGVLACMQAKHSFADGTLSPSSPEFWKSLRAWIDSLGKSPKAPRLELATSLELDQNLQLLLGAATLEADAQKISGILDGIANKAPNQKLEKAYATWKALTAGQKIALLKKIAFVSAEPKLNEIDQELDRRLHRLGIREPEVPRNRQPLLGWFDHLVAQRLDTGGCKITAQEFIDKLSELREDLGPAALASQFATAAAPDMAEERKADPIYLQQLELIAASEAFLVRAIQMVHRARSERNGWLQAKLIGENALEQFDADLIAFWELARAQCQKGSDEERGGQIHDRCMRYQTSLRNTIPRLHVLNGSFYLLSDNPPEGPDVGWHPDYREYFSKE